MINKTINCIIFLTILLYGCSVGSNSTSSAGNLPSGQTEIQISNVATIPYTNYITGEYTLANISNNSEANVTLQSAQIRANGQILSAADTGSYIDLSNCTLIAKQKSCQAKIFTNTTFQSYLLTLNFADNSGKTYTVNQVISFNALLPAQNGFIYDATQLILSNGGLSIPFRLAANYTRISVLINDTPAQFSCYNNTYRINTLCTATINSKIPTTSLSGRNNIKIIGYNNQVQIANTIMLLTNSQSDNLITSGQNVVINPDDGSSPQTVYLVNNGLSNATAITITPKTPVTISANTCTSTLAPGSSCSFIINVTSLPISGQSSVAISYSNSQTTQLLYFKCQLY